MYVCMNIVYVCMICCVYVCMCISITSSDKKNRKKVRPRCSSPSHFNVEEGVHDQYGPDYMIDLPDRVRGMYVGSFVLCMYMFVSMCMYVCMYVCM